MHFLYGMVLFPFLVSFVFSPPCVCLSFGRITSDAHAHTPHGLRIWAFEEGVFFAFLRYFFSLLWFSVQGEKKKLDRFFCLVPRSLVLLMLNEYCVEEVCGLVSLIQFERSFDKAIESMKMHCTTMVAEN